MLSNEELSYFAEKLAISKQKIKDHIDMNDHFGLRKDENFYNYVGELSTYDNHPADTGTELFEREKDLAIDDHYRIELQQIDDAFAAIKNGTYGICETCGKEIPKERLEAIPSAVTCVEHSKNQVVSENRPIEEEVMHAYIEEDHENENVGFDEEDSWQAVAEWGNSDTPSDFFNPPEHYDQMYINSDEEVGYVEFIENSIGNDITGKNIQVYPTAELEEYEDALDEEGIMTTFGDLKEYEQEPYVED